MLLGQKKKVVQELGKSGSNLNYLGIWLLFMANLRPVLTEDLVMGLDMVMSHDLCVVDRKKLLL